jgi:hypothetical protein
MSNGNGRTPWLPVTLIGALAMILSAWILGASAVRVANSRAAVTVTGSAKREIRSDFAVWRGQYSVNARTLQEAYAQLEAAQGIVRTFLAAQNPGSDSLTFASVSIQPFYATGPDRMPTSQVNGYRLSQTVELRSVDVDKITRISRASTELIRQGVVFESYAPEYLYTKLADLKVEMLALATRDARARALEMAKNSDSRIGRLRSARMGVFQITPQHSTAISDYGINDTSSLIKDVTAVVSVSFEIL